MMETSEQPILTSEEAEMLFYEMMDETYEPQTAEIITDVELSQRYMKVLERRSEIREEREQYARHRIASLYQDDFGTVEPRLFGVRGDWAVTNLGIMCLKHYYLIERNRVFGRHWIDHMAGKGWVNMYDFLRCLLLARVSYGQSGSEA